MYELFMHQLSCNPHLQNPICMISQFSDNGPRAKETSDKIKPQFNFIFPRFHRHSLFLTFHFFYNILCPQIPHRRLCLNVSIQVTARESYQYHFT